MFEDASIESDPLLKRALFIKGRKHTIEVCNLTPCFICIFEVYTKIECKIQLPLQNLVDCEWRSWQLLMATWSATSTNQNWIVLFGLHCSTATHAEVRCWVWRDKDNWKTHLAKSSLDLVLSCLENVQGDHTWSTTIKVGILLSFIRRESSLLTLKEQAYPLWIYPTNIATPHLDIMAEEYTTKKDASSEESVVEEIVQRRDFPGKIACVQLCTVLRTDCSL